MPQRLASVSPGELSELIARVADERRGFTRDLSKEKPMTSALATRVMAHLAEPAVYRRETDSVLDAVHQYPIDLPERSRETSSG